MADDRPVFFFDIDNCLYSRKRNVQQTLDDLIEDYIMQHASISRGEAQEVHKGYASDYGMAVKAMTQLYDIDALDFNRSCDDALPLQELLSPDPELRAMLAKIDTKKVKPWLFTNAYINHGKRVVKILGVEDLFEGLTYCDYGVLPICCKPKPDAFYKAMREAGETEASRCYLIDDNYVTCTEAEKLGWNVVHFLEPHLKIPESYVCKHQVASLFELPKIFPQFFMQ